MRIGIFTLIVITLIWSVYIQRGISGGEMVATTQPASAPSPSPSPSSSPGPRMQMFAPAATVSELQDELKRLDEFEKQGAFEINLVSSDRTSGTLEIFFNPSDQRTMPELHGIDLAVLNLPDDVITQIVIAVLSNQSKAGELEGVEVKQIGATAKYEVVKDYTYQANNYKITAPKGFVYDRATIPRVFWAIIDKDSLSNVAPLFHDLLYSKGGKLPENQVVPYRTFTREEADNLLLELMTKCGVTYLRRNLAYRAVRGFAGSHWNGKP